MSRAIVVFALASGCGGRSDLAGDAIGSSASDGAADALATPACGLTDRAAHPPPPSGSFGYAPQGDFMPGKPGFPKIGQSYVDAVFGCTVHRLTDGQPGWGN